MSQEKKDRQKARERQRERELVWEEGKEKERWRDQETVWWNGEVEGRLFWNKQQGSILVFLLAKCFVVVYVFFFLFLFLLFVLLASLPPLAVTREFRFPPPSPRRERSASPPTRQVALSRCGVTTLACHFAFYFLFVRFLFHKFRDI